MRELAGGERARLSGGHFNVHVRVELEDQDGDWQDMSDFGGRDFPVSVAWKETIDSAVRAGTLVLSRVVGPASLAPLMTGSGLNVNDAAVYAPFIRGGQKVRISTACTAAGVAPVDGDWHEVFLGKCDDPEWGDDANQITLQIVDQGGWLTAQFIQVETTYGTADGIPVETIMQQILDANVVAQLGAVTLHVPTSPAVNFRTYQQTQQPVLEALRSLAQEIGWDVRYRYDTDGVDKLTLYNPGRDRTEADTSFGPAEYFRLPSVTQGTSDVRNFVRVRFVDASSGLADYRDATDGDSIAKYGVQFMEVDQGATSNIDTGDEAQALANAMVSDLANPLLAQQMRTSYFWAAQLGDLYDFDQNGVHYDETQTLAVTEIDVTLSRNEFTSVIGVRGKPAGAYTDWLTKRGTTGPVTQPLVALKNFREIARDLAANTITYGWDSDARIAAIAEYVKDLEEPFGATQPWPVPVAGVWPDPDTLLPGSTTSRTYAFPSSGNRYAELVPIASADARHGDYQRITITAHGLLPQIYGLTQADGLSGLFTDVTIHIDDSKGLGGVLRAWVNHGDPGDADSTGAPDGHLTVAVTPATVGPTDDFDGTPGVLLNNIRIHVGVGKRIAFEFANAHGVSSGVITFHLKPSESIIDSEGHLTDPGLADSLALAISAPYPLVGSSLPADDTDTDWFFRTTDRKLYHWITSAWVKAATVDGGDIIADTIIAGALSAGTVTAEAMSTGAISAVFASIGVLSDISGDAGIIVAGALIGVDGSIGLDLNATGSEAVLSHALFSLYADGTADFSAITTETLDFLFNSGGIGFEETGDISWSSSGTVVATIGGDLFGLSLGADVNVDISAGLEVSISAGTAFSAGGGTSCIVQGLDITSWGSGAANSGGAGYRMVTVPN